MDITAYALAKSKAKAYTDAAIAALPKGVIYKGAVDYYSSLPASPELGDAYTVKYSGSSGTVADGTEYVWGPYDGTNQWNPLGTNAYSKADADSLLATKLAEPSTGLAVGKYFRIASIDASGHAVLEAVDATTIFKLKTDYPLPSNGSGSLRLTLGDSWGYTYADGIMSMVGGAGGTHTTSNGWASFAFGNGTVANSVKSFAFGQQATTNGSTSCAIGAGVTTNASAYAQIIVGQWYEGDANDQFAVGIGGSSSAKNYSMRSKKNGDFLVRGTAYTNCDINGNGARVASYFIKTAMDAVAVAGAQYYLGQQSAVSITLPATALAGQEIVVVFYSGSTAATLTVSGTVIGDTPTPAANQRIELNYLWDGVAWCLVSKVDAYEAVSE